MIKFFSIPADFSLDNLHKIHDLNQKYEDSFVDELYGQITDAPILESGRVTSTIPQVTFKELEQYVKECNKYKIKFNYTLNPSCMGNFEFTNIGIKTIIGFIKKLREIGIVDITVTIPALMELIQSVSKDFKIKASAICEIINPTKAIFYQNIGVDKIVLDPDITRNFGVLKNIRKVFKGKIEIIANNVCLKNCPYKKFHYNHDSHCIEKDPNIILDYYTNRCSLQKASNFENPIKLNWIRPEDLSFYTDIGIQYFKIQGRQNIIKGDIIRTLEAYMSMNYEGNLFDLITIFAQYNSFQVYIDNKKLKGFLRPFATGKLTCEDICEECRYCYNYMSRSTFIDDAKIKNENCQKFFQDYDKYKITINQLSSYKNIEIKNFDE